MSNIVQNTYGIFYYDDNREYHRQDGPAVERPSGSKLWYKHGDLHRQDGPAVEYPGAKEWWINGLCHRIDGPAIEYSNGRKLLYIDGIQYTKQQYNRLIKLLFLL